MTTNMTIDTGYKVYAVYWAEDRMSKIVVKESIGWRDYMVEVWLDGEHIVEQDYFTTDKADAIQHAKAFKLYIDSTSYCR